MATGDTYYTSSTGIADTGDLIVDGTGAGTGAAEITELGGTGACDIYREVDTAGDGTWATSVLIGQVSANWHAQINELFCSSAQSVRLRINNTSGGPIAAYAGGVEVDN